MKIRRIRPSRTPAARTCDVGISERRRRPRLARSPWRRPRRRTRRRPAPCCPRHPGRGVSPRRDVRPRSRSRGEPARRSGRRPVASVDPSRDRAAGASADRSSGPSARAIQTPSHEPVSSQRTSKSETAPPTPGIGSPACPTNRHRPATGRVAGDPVPASCRWDRTPAPGPNHPRPRRRPRSGRRPGARGRARPRFALRSRDRGGS